MTGPPRPCPLVLAAPSGAGKTSIARALVDRSERFVFSVSATTRPRRAGERDGVDYHFVSPREFEGMVERGELVEWAEVHGHRYGTPRRNLEDAQARGLFPVLDIDVQGARQIRDAVPEAILVYVLPPSGEALARRLEGRGTEGAGEARRRLATARRELEAAPEFDYVVMNDVLERAVEAVRRIVEAESRRPARLPRLPGEIHRLQGEIDRILERSPDE